MIEAAAGAGALVFIAAVVAAAVIFLVTRNPARDAQLRRARAALAEIQAQARTAADVDPSARVILDIISASGVHLQAPRRP